MAKVIRLGDPTSHGGIVLSAAAQVNVMNKPVARVGDLCSCPIPGHGICTIIEGDSNDIIDGRAVAYEGHKTSCGATLIATATNYDKS